MVYRPDRPQRCFRIADRRHPLLDGMGSFLNGGRWTSRGRLVVYAAETYAGALLEVLVHSNLGFVPHTHVWIEIPIPVTIGVEEVAPETVPGWDSPDFLVSRAYGDRWHTERRTPLLLVPSAVTSGVERNVLINQDHPQFAALTSSGLHEVAWDRRLFHHGTHP